MAYPGESGVKGDPMAVYSVRLPRELREALRQAAIIAGWSEGQVVRLALSEHLSPEKRP